MRRTAGLMRVSEFRFINIEVAAGRSLTLVCSVEDGAPSGDRSVLGIFFDLCDNYLGTEPLLVEVARVIPQSDI